MDKTQSMMIHSEEDMDMLAVERGFLPFFYCGIPGLSIEEQTPRERWFSDSLDGPWEWKGPVIAMGSAAYGKLFRGKAGYVSLEWMPHLINYRRARYPLATDEERHLLDLLNLHETLLTHEWKELAGYTQPRRKPRTPLERAMEADGPAALRRAERADGACRKKAAFDSLVTRLQMGTHVVIADFEYNHTRDGARYGWGKARYTTPELMYGDVMNLPTCSPEESLARMVSHLHHQFPNVDERAWVSLLG
jgi:hypothetical protein